MIQKGVFEALDRSGRRLLNQRSLVDVVRTPSQPTKTRLWLIDTTSPMCEEDAVQQDQDFVEKHTKSLRSAIRIVRPYPSLSQFT